MHCDRHNYPDQLARRGFRPLTSLVRSPRPEDPVHRAEHAFLHLGLRFALIRLPVDVFFAHVRLNVKVWELRFEYALQT